MESFLYPNADVEEIVEAVRGGIVAALADNLEGIYLKGSLALGDFNPQTSDVDLLVVVRRALNQADFERLDGLHRRLQTLTNRYAHDLELAYIPASKLNNFVPGEYPSLERGEGLKWKTLRSNWILDFWIVREHGLALFGPDPKTLIDPISADQMREAVRGVLSAWNQWVDTWDSPGWKTHMGEMRFVVETMCRAGYTLAFKQMCSKPVAVRWALTALPESWRALVEQSQTWQGGQETDWKLIPQIRDFVYWTAQQA